MSCFGRLRKKKNPPSQPVPVVVPSPQVQMGVSVFCGWANPRAEFGAVPGVMCPAEWPWKALQTDDRNMALGQYDEADPAVTVTRCEWMIEAGIDFCTYQIEWAHEHSCPDKRPRWRKVLDSPLTMSHCADNHPEDSPSQFCVSWWDTMAWDDIWREMLGNGWTVDDVIDSHRQFARTVAVRYMTRPNYLSVSGRPVLMRGAAETLLNHKDRFGFDLTPAQVVTIWRDEIRAVTGKELYLVGTSVDPPVRPLLKGWGFDALTEYLLHGYGWDDTMRVYRDWWARDLKECKESGLDFWVPTTSGYDSKAWGSPVAASHMPTASQFTEHLKEARALAAANGIGFVLTYAWNENGEGGIVEKMAAGQLHDGDEMVRAHRAVL